MKTRVLIPHLHFFKSSKRYGKKSYAKPMRKVVSIDVTWMLLLALIQV